MNNLCTLRFTGCRLTRLRLMRDRLEAEMVKMDKLPGPNDPGNPCGLESMDLCFQQISTFQKFCETYLIVLCARIDPEVKQTIRLPIVQRYARIIAAIGRLEKRFTSKIPPHWDRYLSELERFAWDNEAVYERDVCD